MNYDLTVSIYLAEKDSRGARIAHSVSRDIQVESFADLAVIVTEFGQAVELFETTMNNLRMEASE